jgi:glycosyltransferase involved in cell wall biosynthesis
LNLLPHISVCVCTYKRTELLPELLQGLESQYTGGLFTFEVVIGDNDGERSAESLVSRLAAASKMSITYCVEPLQNIALVRNRTIEAAKGRFLAFIDDDELPISRWLHHLFVTHVKYGGDAVLGPVLPRFVGTPPPWVIRGRFFDRPRHLTGYRVQWPEARTGNVLLANEVWKQLTPPFRPQFGSGGEDVDFFRRLSELGCTFTWSDEATVDEWVPPYRCTRRFLIRRALLRGSNFPKQPARRARNTVKSLVAVPCYAAALPLLAVVGHHHFVKYLVKLLDHSSRLLALAGVHVSTERQV